MQPLIRDGETIVAAPLGEAALRPGAVYVYERDSGGIIAHTLIAINGEQMIFRGLRAEENDPAVGRESILGRVVSVERNGRSIVLIPRYVRRVTTLSRLRNVPRHIALLRS